MNLGVENSNASCHEANEALTAAREEDQTLGTDEDLGHEVNRRRILLTKDKRYTSIPPPPPKKPRARYRQTKALI